MRRSSAHWGGREHASYNRGVARADPDCVAVAPFRGSYHRRDFRRRGADQALDSLYWGSCMNSLPDWLCAMFTWGILAHLNKPRSGAAALAASAMFTSAIIARLFG